MTLTPFQKKALAVEKTKAAATLARKKPALAKQVASILPDTPKVRLHKIAALRAQVTHLHNRLEREALSEEETPRITYSLGVAADSLKKLTAASARHRALSHSRTTGLQSITGEDARKKQHELTTKLRQAQSQIAAARHSFVHAPTEAHKHQASTRLTVLNATIASLKYRLAILRKGLAVKEDGRIVASRDLRNQLPKMALPRMFKAPDRVEAATAVRLIASNRPRRADESEEHYRATLKAYLKRALLRKINKQHLDGASAIAEGVSEALQHDGAAIEEANKLGGVPADELGNTVDAAVQDSAEEIEQAVIDFQPNAKGAVRKGLITANVKDAAAQAIQMAATESAALAAEGEEPIDQVLTPTSDGTHVDVVKEPFYKKKEFLIGVAAVTAALLVWRR